jgi:hypothetical protein
MMTTSRAQKMREEVASIHAWSEVVKLRRLASKTAAAYEHANAMLRRELAALIDGDES